MKKLTYLLASAALALPATANAAVIWDWDFAGEKGTFTTDGTAPGNVAAPGTYNFIDFAVTASSFGRQLGSVSGGQYLASGFSTNLPYSFNWNGSAVTFWNSAGGNGFDWWVFGNAANPNLFHFFGRNVPNVNDPAFAGLYNNASRTDEVTSLVTVAVAGAGAVPEPATWLMMIMGFGLVGAAMRRKRESVQVSYG